LRESALISRREKEKGKKSYIGSETTPCITDVVALAGKGDTLAQRAVSLLH